MISKLSLKLIASSIVVTTSATSIYIKTKHFSSSNRSFESSKKQKEKHHSNGINIKEFFPNQLPDSKKFKTMRAEFSDSHNSPINGGNISLNKEHPEDQERGFDVLASYSLSDAQIETHLKGKKNVYLLINSCVVVDQSHEQYENLPSRLKDNDISFDQLIDMNDVLSTQNLFLKTASIEIARIPIDKHIFLKIDKHVKDQKTIFTFLTKKELSADKFSNPFFKNVEEKTYFNFLYSSANNESELALDLSNESTKVSRKTFGSTEKKERKWLHPTFELGGFDTNTNKEEAKYYFLKGSDDNYGHLLENPQDFINMSTENKKGFQNVFSSKMLNPHRIGGMIFDNVNGTFQESTVRYSDGIATCKNYQDQTITSDFVKDRCKLGIGNFQFVHNSIEPIPFDGNDQKNNHKNALSNFQRVQCLKATVATNCTHIEPDVFPHPTKINPKIAKTMYDLQTHPEQYNIPHYDKYKSYWKMPKLEKPFVQAIYETKDSVLKDFAKNTKDKTKTTSKPTSTPQFPAFFVRTADFRTYGDVQKTAHTFHNFHMNNKQNESGNYSSHKENSLKSEHKFAIRLPETAWQKHLLNNDFFSKDNITGANNNQLRTGFSVNVPVDLVIQDVASKNVFKSSFNWKSDINLEVLQNKNKARISSTKIPLSNLTSVNLGHVFWNAKNDKIPDKNTLLGDMELNVFLHLDDSSSLVVTWHMTISRFINDRSSACDLRDWDIYDQYLNRREKINNQEQKSLYYCPYYEKLPTMMSVAIAEAPKVSPYWYVNNMATQKQQDLLSTTALSKRIVSETINLMYEDKQTAQITDLKPKGSSTQHIEECVSVTTPGWFSSTTTKTHFLSYYGIDEKSTTPKNQTENPEHWTSFEVVGLNSQHVINLEINSPDSQRAPILINAKHPLSVKQAIFTNTNIKQSDKSDRTHVGIDGQSYGEHEKDKSALELIKYEKPVVLKIDPNFITSTDKNNPTWIPFRISFIYNSTVKFNEIKDTSQDIVQYILKKDNKLNGSKAFVETAPKGKCSMTKDWNQGAKTNPPFGNKKQPLSFVGMGFFAYKTTHSKTTTFHFKSKIWGVSYAYDAAPTNSKADAWHGSEGAAGMELSSIGVLDKTKNNKQDT